MGRLLLLLLSVVVAGPVFGDAVLRLSGPGPAAGTRVEVLPWAGGPRASVLASLRVPGERVLPAGSYGLRVAGTDHRFGPVQLSDGDRRVVRLARVGTRPAADSAPVVHFLVHPHTGASAARLASGVAGLVLPGAYDLVRDMSRTRRRVTVAAGEDVRWELGAVALSGPWADAAFHLLDAKGAAAAYGRPASGPLAVAPGTYTLVREGSGVVSAPLVVRGGAVTRVPHGVVVVHAVGLGSVRKGYVVFRRGDWKIALTSKAGAGDQPVFPGEYAIATQSIVQAALESGDEKRLRACQTLLVRPGTRTSLWLRVDGRLWHPGQQEIDVQVDADAAGRVASAAPLRVRIPLAEAGQLTLKAVAADGSVLQTWPARAGVAPGLNADLPWREPLASGTEFQLEAELTRQGGSTLRGGSAPCLAVAPQCGAVPLPQFTVTHTTVTLRWDAAPGQVAGYRVYRFPAGRVALGGTEPVASREHLDLGLSAGRRYRYVVRAVDPQGLMGPPSPPVEARTNGLGRGRQ